MGQLKLAYIYIVLLTRWSCIFLNISYSILWDDKTDIFYNLNCNRTLLFSSVNKSVNSSLELMLFVLNPTLNKYYLIWFGITVRLTCERSEFSKCSMGLLNEVIYQISSGCDTQFQRKMRQKYWFHNTTQKYWQSRATGSWHVKGLNSVSTVRDP